MYFTGAKLRRDFGEWEKLTFSSLPVYRGAKYPTLAIELTLFLNWDNLTVYRFSAEIYHQTKFTGRKLNVLISNPNIPTRHIEDAPKLSKYTLKLKNSSTRKGTLFVE